MTKSATKSIIIIIVLIVIGVIWYSVSRSPKQTGSDVSTTTGTTGTSSSTPSLPASPAIPSSGTTKVSSSLSEYKNDELGFSVKYPTVWEKEETNSGVNFIIPIDKAQVNTVATLQANIQAVSGPCAFPPVTTVKERSTVKVDTLSFNMISISNSVQGRAYFSRYYSLQKDKICYMFAFASITQPLSSQSLTGSKATQAENNNKALLNAADKAFTDMTKSFAFVVGPQGIDETKAPKP